MPQKTPIGWTDYSTNPVRFRRKSDGKMGWHCVKCSPGCANCYSEAVDGRFGLGLGYTRAASGEVEPVLIEKELDALGRIRTPSRFFVESMSDLFLDEIPDWMILRVFDAMRSCTWAGGANCGRIGPGGQGHTFQVLTKRAGRMADFCRRMCWDGEALNLDGRGTPMLLLNGDIWVGVSVEDQQRADERIPLLLGTPARTRFLSAEPLLGEIDLSAWLFCDRCRNPYSPCGRGAYETPLDNAAGGCWFRECRCSRIAWAIVGGESGPHRRPMELGWLESIAEQCRDAGVACYVKQASALRDSQQGRITDRLWSIKEFPRVPAEAP